MIFGSSKRRQQALREQVEQAEFALEPESRAYPSALEAIEPELRKAITDVEESDGAAIAEDLALEALVRNARALLQRVPERAKELRAEEKRSSDARLAGPLIKKHKITRCLHCQGGGFFVRDQVSMETRDGVLHMALIVCAGCGDVRFRLHDARVLDKLKEDRDFAYVELPSAGPFRG